MTPRGSGGGLESGARRWLRPTATLSPTCWRRTRRSRPWQCCVGSGSVATREASRPCTTLSGGCGGMCARSDQSRGWRASSAGTRSGSLKPDASVWCSSRRVGSTGAKPSRHRLRTAVSTFSLDSGRAGRAVLTGGPCGRCLFAPVRSRPARIPSPYDGHQMPGLVDSVEEFPQLSSRRLGSARRATCRRAILRSAASRGTWAGRP